MPKDNNFRTPENGGCEYAHLSTEYVSLESLDVFLKSI